MTESTHATPGGVATRTTRDLTKAAVSGWLGTAMEFMDFQLYSLAAAIRPMAGLTLGKKILLKTMAAASE